MKKDSPVPLVVEDAEHHAAEDQHGRDPAEILGFLFANEKRREENLDPVSAGAGNARRKKRGGRKRGREKERRRDRGTTGRDSTILGGEYSALGHSTANIRQK